MKAGARRGGFHACGPCSGGLVGFRRRVGKCLFNEILSHRWRGGACSRLKCARVKAKEGVCLIAAGECAGKISKLLRVAGGRPAPAPVAVSRKLADEEEPPLNGEDQNIFRKVTGVARWLRHYKPETGFTVKELSHSLKTAYPADMARAKRYARYLQGTRGRGVTLPRHNRLCGPIKAVSDTDWAQGQVSRRSTASGCVKINGSLLSDFCPGAELGDHQLRRRQSIMEDALSAPKTSISCRS